MFHVCRSRNKYHLDTAKTQFANLLTAIENAAALTMADYTEEDTVGYWDEYGVYQYYEQQSTEESQQWYGDGGSAPSSPTNRNAAAVAINTNWELAYDDDNNPYYFNHNTSEWQYEVPDDYVDPYAVDLSGGQGEYHAPIHEELGYWDENNEYIYYEASATPDEQNLLNETTGTEDGATASNFTDSQGWQAVDDGYGNVYYYNNVTLEQQWDEPISYTEESTTQPWSAEALDVVIDGSVEHTEQAENTTIENNPNGEIQGTPAEHNAAIRIQSNARRRTAKQMVERKKKLHGDMKQMHSSAVTNNSEETMAAIKVQALIRRKKAMARSKDMRALAPMLKRIQDCIEAKRTLYGSPIEDMYVSKI